jgi:hypothetical protein
MKNIEEICLETFRTKIGNDPVLLKRLKFELIEVEVQDMASYFLDLQENGKKHKNENNLMIPWLLGICDEFDHTQDSAHKFGDYPDIDNDLHPQMQKYIKEVWAPQRFGPQFVCNIGNYGTYGLKSSFLDSARIHGLSRDEVLNVTKKLKMKDDEGEILDFDSALELYPEFKEYTVKYPEVTEFALKLMSRLKNMGTHAGGLIISSQELAEIVPLSRPNRNVALASSWGEGLHGQDLSPVGLIKIDLLGLRTLVQISDASRMVKSRYNLRGICATQENEEWDWGDTSYLNDPQCLETARKANLRCVFQFGSDGIRALTRSANISSFDDIAALTALYRPGPMDCLKKDTKISTDKGKVNIQKLKSGHHNVSYVDSNGNISYTSLFSVIKSGKKKVFKIKTKSGKVLYASEEHRLLLDGNNYVKVGNLKKGDKITIEKNKINS